MRRPFIARYSLQLRSVLPMLLMAGVMNAPAKADADGTGNFIVNGSFESYSGTNGAAATGWTFAPPCGNGGEFACPGNPGDTYPYRVTTQTLVQTSYPNVGGRSGAAVLMLSGAWVGTPAASQTITGLTPGSTYVMQLKVAAQQTTRSAIYLMAKSPDGLARPLNQQIYVNEAPSMVQLTSYLFTATSTQLIVSVSVVGMPTNGPIGTAGKAAIDDIRVSLVAAAPAVPPSTLSLNDQNYQGNTNSPSGNFRGSATSARSLPNARNPQGSSNATQGDSTAFHPVD